MLLHLRNTPFVKHFDAIRMSDVESVGGKNASLGEMSSQLSAMGIRVPIGFCLTTAAYRHFLHANHLQECIATQLQTLDQFSLKNLAEVGSAIRSRILAATMPEDLVSEVAQHLLESNLLNTAVAVRSSGTAEDLPGASFAGQHDSFLNITGVTQVMYAVQRCYASLYNDRAIKYRADHGFDQLGVGISAGIQQMVRSDLASAGVAFSCDPDTGFKRFIYLTSSWGLCENIVQGAVSPDEYYFWKASIEAERPSLIYRRLGTKERTMVYEKNLSAASTVRNTDTSAEKQHQWSLNRDDAEVLARWCLAIEKHYQCPMDIEWAKDGLSSELFIVQARPLVLPEKSTLLSTKEYSLEERSTVLCSGQAVGRSIVSGRVCVVQSLSDAVKVEEGDVIVADNTNPDWNALLRKAVSIVTNRGGRTSHASIVARELGIPAVVGTKDATAKLHDGAVVTVSCAEGETGIVYDGKLKWTIKEKSLHQHGISSTDAMLILADPDKAMRLSLLPNAGVGLMRLEFVIAKSICVHPMALVHYDLLPDAQDKQVIDSLTSAYSRREEYFVEKLSEAIAMVAASFNPKDVIVRFSDFKSNEYADLIGGKFFELHEENPMLGFRGASRYYHDRYRDAFALECAAIKRVREELGLRNVKVMIPFCRSIDEAKKVLATMQEFGLTRGKDGLEVYVMAEIPSNVILAEQFAALFDGFSIGSNDLTQLCLGVDRDSALLAPLFDESNDAVLAMLELVIQRAKKCGRKIGLCGQAPSDNAEFARFLVKRGIDSISFSPDALVQGIANIQAAEHELEYP